LRAFTCSGLVNSVGARLAREEAGTFAGCFEPETLPSRTSRNAVRTLQQAKVHLENRFGG
jgi:hypothetical protein